MPPSISAATETSDSRRWRPYTRTPAEHCHQCPKSTRARSRASAERRQPTSRLCKSQSMPYALPSSSSASSSSSKPILPSPSASTPCDHEIKSAYREKSAERCSRNSCETLLGGSSDNIGAITTQQASNGPPPISREKPHLACANDSTAKDLVEQTLALLHDIWYLPSEEPIPPIDARSSAKCGIPALESEFVREDPERPSSADVAARAAIDARLLLTPPEPTCRPKMVEATFIATITPVSTPDSKCTEQGQEQTSQRDNRDKDPNPILAAQPSESGKRSTTPTLRYFVTEILRRSHTLCRTLEIAICYIGALRSTVQYVLRERFKVLRDAARKGISVKEADRRGIFGTPVHDVRRMFLAALVLATKFHQDRSYSNKAWSKLSGLSAIEVTRCENALGAALDWRLWVGHVTPQPQDGLVPCYQSPRASDAFASDCISFSFTAPGPVCDVELLTPPATDLLGSIDSPAISIDVDDDVLHLSQLSDDDKTAFFIANSMVAEERRMQAIAQARSSAKRSLRRTATESSIVDDRPYSSKSGLKRTSSIPAETIFKCVQESLDVPPSLALHEFVGHRVPRPAAPYMVDDSTFMSGVASLLNTIVVRDHEQVMEVDPMPSRSSYAHQVTCSMDISRTVYASPQSSTSQTCGSGLSTPNTAFDGQECPSDLLGGMKTPFPCLLAPVRIDDVSCHHSLRFNSTSNDACNAQANALQYRETPASVFVHS